MKIKNQEGWLAIEAMAAVMVMLTSVPIFYNLWAFSKAEEEKAVIAGQLKTVGEAFEGYVQDNYTTLKATATPTVAVSTTFATLQAGGYVQASISSTNIWGQGYVNYVLQPKPGTLEIITLTTGPARNDTDFLNQLVPGTAVKIGSKGGYVPSGLLPGQAATTMQGSYNGWKKSFTGTNIPNPGAGHLAYYASTDDIAAGGDFLYRKSVPGNPDLNKMETGLNMGNNAVTNVGSQTMKAGGGLNMNGGAISAASTITATGNVTAGKVTLPGGNTLQIGGSSYYGDTVSSAVRQDGAFYVQHYDGTAADIAMVRNIGSSGSISASGNVTADDHVIAPYFSDANNGGYYVDPNSTSRMNYNVVDNLHAYGGIVSAGNINASGDIYGRSLVTQNGIIYGVSDNWGMQLLNSGWGANAAPTSAVGSAYVNDILFRSTGKWASQMGGVTLKGIYTITYPKGNMGPHICNAGSVEVGKDECYGYGSGCTYTIWCQILN